MPSCFWKGTASLGEQLRTFDKGQDDLLDALAYCISMARAPKGEEDPRPYIAVDPAYTVNRKSDHTGIAVGCRWKGHFWLLDCQKFKTDKPDVIARMVFRMYDKWHSKLNIFGVSDKKQVTYAAPVPSRHKYFGRRRGRRVLEDVPFTVNYGQLFKPIEENENA